MTGMRRTHIALAAAAVLGAAGLTACAYNETLGRNQLLLVDDAALAQAAASAWQEALSSGQVSRDAAQNDRVRRVGGRVAQAAGMGGLNWEYAVFRSDTPNAFVLPGGRMGVTTGLLSLVRNDDQLAAVLGHEVGHITARHAAERYSQTAAAQAGLQIATGVAGDYGRAVGALGGLGAQLGVLLPFSRQHELEADRLGVDYMARAGYDPREALALWRLMSQQRQTSTPEFASTHPADSTRIAALEAYMRERGLL